MQKATGQRTYFLMLACRLGWLGLGQCGLGMAQSQSLANVADELGQQCEIRVQECAELKNQNIQVFDNIPWVCKKALTLQRQRKLPEKYAVDITLHSASPLLVKEWMRFIQSNSGLVVRLSPDAEAKLLGQYKINSSETKSSYASSSFSNSQSENIKDPLLTPIFKQSYCGSLEGLLDFLGAELGLSWKFEDDRVVFYFLETRTFKLHVIPSSTKISSTMNASATTDSSGAGSTTLSSSAGQSNQTTSVEINTDILGDIAKNIEQILTPGIGRYALASSTGYITVSDTEEVLSRIERYITTENACLTKQVLLNVKVLTVQLKDSNQCEIDWKILAEKLSLGGSSSSDALGGLLDMNLPVKGQSGIVYDFLNGRLGIDSIGLFINLLSEQGKVSVLTSPSVTTLNLQPVPVQVAQQQNYLARQTVSTSSEGSSTSLEAGTVTSGLSMNLLPFITEDNQILLQYSINLSDLVRMDTISGGDAMQDSDDGADGSLTSNQSILQLPVVDNRIFTQKVRMRSGQTLLLAGYEQQKGEKTGSSPLPWVSKLWGKSNHSQEHKSTIILITPIILE